MLRLFVAIRPPPSVRDQLQAVMGGVSGARWQDDDLLHLTLRFVGEVDRHVAADVHAALGSVHHPRFEIALAGIGSFETRGRPDTLWAGVTPNDPVRALNRKVEQAFTRVGLPPEQRAFHPHVTLARLNRSAGPVGNFLAVTQLTTPPFDVTRFGLFESRLTPEGAVYTELESYPLYVPAMADISRSTSPA